MLLPRHNLPVKLLFALVLASAVAAAQTAPAASTARAIEQMSLDLDHCYRVRDLAFQREDIKMYLNEGHLMFAKPVEGRRLAAVFVGDVPGGDAELMVFPPHSSERMSLASFTKTPNLDEHFLAGVLLFSDDTATELLELLKDAKKEPDSALVISGRFDSVLRNIATSYEIRLLYDLFSPDWKQNGIFSRPLRGKLSATSMRSYDPRGREQVLAGQLVYREDRRYFDTWTSFRSRSVRNGSRKPAEDQFAIEGFNIEATLHPDLALKGRTRIKVIAKARIERVIPLDLSRRMKVTEVRVDGQPANSSCANRCDPT